MSAARHRRLLARLEAEEFAAFLCTDRANVRYLTGFSGSNGWLFVAPSATTLLTDARYRDQANDETDECDVVIATTGLSAALTEPLRSVSGPVAFESTDVTVAVWEELRRTHEHVEWKSSDNLVEQLRARKEEAEVQAIRKALEIAEAALESTVAGLRVGTSEIGLAAALEHACRSGGAERMAFDTIVAAGSRGALPHARPSERTLQVGELLVVDMGCVVAGYASDITRAVFLGNRLPPPWDGVHESLEAARAAALAAMRSGVPARQADAAAREALTARDLGDAFVHSLGHGVGLHVHEAPRLAQRSDETLAAGNVVTVEPGVYLPGEGGMRLEDMVLVTETGVEVLNRLPAAPLFAPL